jgi:hypothetical protein
MKRAWPVHFIIGSIGLYFRRGTVFGNRERGYTLPIFSHSTEKPSMINTMCRTPVHYTPGHAHDYLVRNVISGSENRSDPRPDRGRLPCMAVDPLSRSATIKGGQAGARKLTFTVSIVPPQTLTT